jgi:hypothetical protein
MGVPSRRIGLALCCAALVAGVAAAGLWIGRDSGEGKDSGTARPPQLNGPLDLSADRLGPGDPFTLTFTDGRVVPGDFSLAVWDGFAWTYQYQLFGVAEPFEDGAQAWRTWRERTSYVPDQAVGGKGLVHLVMPSHLISGDYRLCAETTVPPVCAGLVVD